MKLPICYPKWPYHSVFPSATYRVLVALHPCQHLVLSVFLMTAILVGVRWYLRAVWICISLMVNGVEQFFMCLFVISISYFFEISIQIFCLFLKTGLMACYWAKPHLFFAMNYHFPFHHHVLSPILLPSNVTIRLYLLNF